MLKKTFEKRSIAPNQAIKILEKSGLKVSEKEAEDILEIMYFLAKLLFKQNLNS
ncbi:hypothetical protein [Olivibacter jilunii]|uniref:hypothetical protein n=1 Tax=Olivibacter jilunii TaxID=985016 RepID=UPI003F1620BF